MMGFNVAPIGLMPRPPVAICEAKDMSVPYEPRYRQYTKGLAKFYIKVGDFVALYRKEKATDVALPSGVCTDFPDMSCAQLTYSSAHLRVFIEDYKVFAQVVSGRQGSAPFSFTIDVTTDVPSTVNLTYTALFRRPN